MFENALPPSRHIVCCLSVAGILACSQAGPEAPAASNGGTPTASATLTSGSGTASSGTTGAATTSGAATTLAGTSSTGAATTTAAVTTATSVTAGTTGDAATSSGFSTGTTGAGGATTSGVSATTTGAFGTSTSSSGGANGATGTTGEASTTGASGPTLPPTTDYAADGPCETTVDTNTGPDASYTIYRPETLGEDGFLHAPIIFGPGINMQSSQMAGLLTAFASHCFVVVGTPVLTGGPNDPGNLSKMQNGLDWIIEQNTQSGIYEGTLYVDHAVSMGYSVGGTAAVELGGHAAVATTVSIHGHIAESDMHGPLLQTSALGDTIGLPMQRQTFEMSQVQTFLGIITDGDHGYIQGDNGGAQRPAIIAWLRYWIYNDTGGQNYFYGDDCVMCQSPWETPERKNWE